jgi:hypothetical protein
MSKINSVKFKDKKSFEKNKNKANVLAVYEPFNVIVFQDDTPVTPDPTKVSQADTVDASLDSIPTGLAILIAKDYAEGSNYLKVNNLVVKDSFELTKTFFVEVPDFVPFDSFYGNIMATGLFISVEPDNIAPVSMDAETPYAGHWHLANMRAAEAWEILPAGVVKEVAVLDIACETMHEDLQGRISSTSWNCVFDTPDVNPISEYEKHGTCCAGVICANTGNDIGCKSISNNHLKVQFLHIGMNSTSGGSFMTSDTILMKAVNKILANPDCVAVSMSWGGGSEKPAFSNGLNQIRTMARDGKGIPIFASSGNSYQSEFTQLPAAYPSVMAVGAIASNNQRAAFSNYGTKLYAAAPGVGVWTVDRTGASGYKAESYMGFGGTSAACPAMAAAAGLVLVKNPDLTEPQVREIIKNSCNKVGGYTYDANGKSLELGYGAIDAYAAVTNAGGVTPLPPDPPALWNIYGLISSPSTVEAGNVVTISYGVSIDKNQLLDTVIPVSIGFKKGDGTVMNFYSGNITILKGTGKTNLTMPYTIPGDVSGPCQFVMTIDPANTINESNETDNVCYTSINVTSPPPPDMNIDLSISISRYEWLTNGSVRVWYHVTNKGTATCTSWKATTQWEGGPLMTWNRNETIRPGQTVTQGTAQSSVLWGKMPNTFKIQIVAVNGVPDANSSNNVATILVNK